MKMCTGIGVDAHLMLLKVSGTFSCSDSSELEPIVALGLLMMDV